MQLGKRSRDLLHPVVSHGVGYSKHRQTNEFIKI